MPTHLQELLREARRNAPTPQDHEEQRRSFAYGNTKIENPRITRDMINKAADELGIPTHLSRSVVAE